MKHIWNASKGRRIPIENLHDDHLVNILQYIEEGSMPRPPIFLHRALKDEAYGRGIAWKRWPKSSADQWKEYKWYELAPSSAPPQSSDPGSGTSYGPINWPPPFPDADKKKVHIRTISTTPATLLGSLESGTRFIFSKPKVEAFQGVVVPVVGKIWVKEPTGIISGVSSPFYCYATSGAGLDMWGHYFSMTEEVVALAHATVKVEVEPTIEVIKVLGTSGNAVISLQDKLAKYRFLPPKESGVWLYGTYDERTREAVRCFQATYKLAQDGVVGRNTWAAIGRYL